MVVLATVQSSICADVHSNGQHIRSAMFQAARQGVRLMHFPECALSGYAQVHIKNWSSVDWTTLKAELLEIAALARRLNLWVVLGSNHRIPKKRGQPQLWPQNCLLVISDRGDIAGRYAKRLCSNTELTYWYTPGVDPLAFDVDGVRFGCALCIEVVFPHLFAEYERLGVTCLLLSSFSQDPIHAVIARAHAATNGYWLSMSTPTSCSHALPAALFGPDGSIVENCAPGMPTMIVRTIDPNDESFRVPVRLARSWRARARSGEMHAGRAVRDPYGQSSVRHKD